MMGKYDDIINLNRPFSMKHPPMPVSDRAAQFSPFAALTGYDTAISESARLTEEVIDLDENAKALLNEKLNLIKAHLSEHPEVTITYFKPDERKSGGKYVNVTGSVKKINQYKQEIVMMDGSIVSIENITEIESKLFICTDY